MLAPATPEVYRSRAARALVGFFCPQCSHILIEAGRPRRKVCPKCKTEPMRSYGGEGLDEVAEALIGSESRRTRHSTRELTAGFGEAFALFNERQDDRLRTREMLRERYGDSEPPEAVVQREYERLRKERYEREPARSTTIRPPRRERSRERLPKPGPAKTLEEAVRQRKERLRGTVELGGARDTKRRP
jgi:hypothetical protein